MNAVPQPLTNCPLCRRDLGSAGFKRLKKYRRDHLVRCRACGFNFSLLDPTPEDLARVYGAYNYVGEDEARTEISIENEARFVERLTPYRNTGAVLDIAAGAGRFLEHFKARGFDCYATEFDANLQRYLTDKGFTVLQGGLFPEAPRDDMFDVVIFTEIIEHINIPVPVLERIFAILRPGGVLYITTPNFSSLERRVLGEQWGMLCWPEHITYWTPRHLHRALRERGFRKEWMSVENLSPLRIVEALKKGRFGGMLANVSEHSVSEAAQKKVAGSRLLRTAKAAVNAGLTASRLGSSIKALYVKPERR